MIALAPFNAPRREGIDGGKRSVLRFGLRFFVALAQANGKVGVLSPGRFRFHAGDSSLNWAGLLLTQVCSIPANFCLPQGGKRSGQGRGLGNAGCFHAGSLRPSRRCVMRQALVTLTHPSMAPWGHC